MKTTLKIVLGVLAAIVLFVAAAPFLIEQFVDPNDYKDEIATAVKEQTGRDLRIDGDIELTVFPWLGVTLGAVELGNAPGFEEAAFVRTRSAKVRVKLQPLLTKRLEMDTVRVDGLEVNLSRNQQGRTNWDDLLALGGEKPDDDGKPPAVAALAVGGLDVRDASVTWEDARAGARYQLKKIALETGGVKAGEPVDLKLEFDLEGGEAQPAGHVALRARVDVDPGAGRYRASGVELDATLKGGPIGPGEVKVKAAADGTFDQSSSKVSLSAFEVALPAFDVDGTSGQLTVKGALEGDVAARTFASEGIAITGDVKGRALGGGEAALEVETAARVDLGAGTVALDRLRFAVPRFAAAGNEGSVRGTGEVAGNLGSRTFAIRGLTAKGDVGGAALQGGKATFDLGANANLDLARQTVALTGVALSLPSVSVAGTSGELRVTGDVGGNLAENVFEAKGLEVAGGLTGVTGVKGKVPVDLTTDARLDLGKNRVTLSRVALGLPGLDLEPASGNLELSAESVTGDLGAGRYALTRLQAKGDLVGKTAFEGKLDLDLDADLDLDLNGRTATAKRFKLQLPAFDVEGNRGKLVLGGALTANLAENTYRVKGMTAEGSVSGAALRRGSAVFKLGTDLEYSVAGQRFSLSGIRLDVPRFEVERTTGGLSLTGDLAGSRVEETYTGRGLTLRAVVSGKPVPGQKLSLEVGTDAAVNVKQQTMDLSKLTLGAMGVEVKGALKVTKFVDAPAYAGRLETTPFNPRKVLAQLKLPRIPTADPKALETAAFAADVSGTRDSIDLSGLTMSLDQSKLEGSLAISGFAKPAFRFDLGLDAIDADRYLPPKRAGQAATPGAAATALPLDLLRSLNASGQVRIGKLKINNIRLANVNLTVKAADAQVRLNPLNASLYGGSYAGNIGVDARGKAATFTADERITGVQAGPLLADVRGKETLSGNADVALTLRGTGADTRQLKQTLAGQGSFSFRDGALKGVDIPGMICRGLSGLGVVTDQGGAGGETRFAELSGTTVITQGVVANDDLSMKSPLLRVRGQGRASLVTEQVDYQVVAGLVGSCQGQGGLSVAELAKVDIPIRVTGTFGNLRYAPDFGAVLRAQGQKQIEKRLKGILGGSGAASGSGSTGSGSSGGGGSRPEDAVKGILEKGLKGLLGR